MKDGFSSKSEIMSSLPQWKRDLLELRHRLDGGVPISTAHAFLKAYEGDVDAAEKALRIAGYGGHA